MPADRFACRSDPTAHPKQAKEPIWVVINLGDKHDKPTGMLKTEKSKHKILNHNAMAILKEV